MSTVIEATVVEAIDTCELWRRYKATKDLGLRQQLVLQYRPLVNYVVRRMAVGVPVMLEARDIISHATIGLIDAIERFDPDRGIKFETYAISRIRGSVLDVVRCLGNERRGMRKRMKEIESAVSYLEEKNGTSPTDEEVATHLGISLQKYNREIQKAHLSIVPLSTSLTSDDEPSLSLSDVIEDKTNPGPEAEAQRSELRAALFGAFKELSERERRLIALYYYEELTLKQIGHILEVSESRVCQIHAQAVLKLRAALTRAGLIATVS